MLPRLSDIPLQPRLQLIFSFITIVLTLILTVFSLAYFFRSIENTAVKTLRHNSQIVQTLLNDKQQNLTDYGVNLAEDKTIQLLLDLDIIAKLSEFLIHAAGREKSYHVTIFDPQATILADVGFSNSILAEEKRILSPTEELLVQQSLKGNTQDGITLLSTPTKQGITALSSFIPIARDKRIIGVLAVYFIFSDNPDFLFRLTETLGVDVSLYTRGTSGVGTTKWGLIDLDSGNRTAVPQVYEKLDLIGSGLDYYRVLTDTQGAGAGILHLHQDGDEFRGVFLTALVFDLIIALVMMVTVTYLVIQISRHILDPIGTLLTGVQKITEGDLGYEISLKSQDEIGLLGNAFNDMRLHLHEKIQEINTLNQELKLLNEMKDQFLANTSHELRTPLSGMTGILEVILDSPEKLTPEIQSQLELVNKSALRLTRLINDILDLSQLKQKKLQIQKLPVDLLDLCTQVMIFFGPLSQGNTLKLSHSELYKTWVMADPARLEQVLVNLLGNAVKFTHEGTIELRLIQENEKVLVQVADTGIGIPQAMQKTIFESFQQGSAEISRDYGGTGLGLTISRDLVLQMGSQLVLESEQGVGSVFSFYLPLARDEETLVSSAPNLDLYPRSLNREKTLLVIDDESINLEVTTAQLRNTSWKVQAFLLAQDALDWLSSHFCDVVVMDVMMPGRSGFEVTRLMRDRGITVPVLYLTARNNPQDILNCLESGGTDLLTKPCGRNYFRSRLELLLDVFPPEGHPPLFLEPGTLSTFHPKQESKSYLFGHEFTHAREKLAFLEGLTAGLFGSFWVWWLPPGADPGSIFIKENEPLDIKIISLEIKQKVPTSQALVELWRLSQT